MTRFISSTPYNTQQDRELVGESLLISSLPGKASRTLVEPRGLSRDSTCILKVRPGKLGNKRSTPGIIFINLSVVLLFKMAIMTLLLIFTSIQRIRHYSKSATLC